MKIIWTMIQFLSASALIYDWLFNPMFVSGFLQVIVYLVGGISLFFIVCGVAFVAALSIFAPNVLIWIEQEFKKQKNGDK